MVQVQYFYQQKLHAGKAVNGSLFRKLLEKQNEGGFEILTCCACHYQLAIKMTRVVHTGFPTAGELKYGITVEAAT